MRTNRLFILDTNVLTHDPSALFRFGDHDLFLPMTVLEELDRAKEGASEISRNGREVSRILDELIDGARREQIAAGIPLAAEGAKAACGRLFFEMQPVEASVGPSAHGGILHTALALKESQPSTTIVVVSKDINLRIKAHVMGIEAEDYYNDKVLDDVSLLHSGLRALPEDFWNRNEGLMETAREADRTIYRFRDALCREWLPGECLYTHGGDGFEGIVLERSGHDAKVTAAHDYRADGSSVWGIHARNREQNFALNLLMDPEVDFVTLLGTAGAGKTLLALAAGLNQTLEAKRYREIVMTRATVSVGEDIGFLPGTEEEKMTPWMGALMDNLEVLTDTDVAGEWGRAAAQDLIHNRVKIRSLSFMRGRTFLNRYIIIDEAQNLSRKQMKTLITRAGPGTKMVCLGNIGQIDTPYLSETTSGLTYVVDRFKGWHHGGHVTLQRGERSRLADFATERL